MLVLTLKERRVLWLLLGCFLLGAALYAVQEKEFAVGREYSVVVPGSKENVAEVVEEKKINLNEATQIELEQIAGIGPYMAKNIISYRNEHRRFFKIDQLKEVKGIGETRFQKIKEFVRIR